MKILITGASGKVGESVANYLLEKNLYCYLNSRKKLNYKKFKNYKVIKCDILSENFYIPLDCDALIHTATVLKKNYNSQLLRKDLKINKKISNLIRKHKNLKKIIFLSTAEVYNKNLTKIVSEKSNNFNKHLYAKIKLKTEKLLSSINSKYIYNVRLPAIIGTLNANNFLTKLANNFNKSKKIKLYNANRLFNNILDIDTLNKFIYSLLRNNFKSGLILLGTKNPTKLFKIVMIFKKFFKYKHNILWSKNENGFYLNINNSIKNYNFKPLNTITVLNNYLKTDFKKYN
jgi:nucleoside-diphosphate-sugar epimerase